MTPNIGGSAAPDGGALSGRSAAPDGGALFIAVEVDDTAASDPELAAKLEEVCPVDIFKNADGRVEIVQQNLDECVLCELCINASPPGAVRVIKLYSGETLPV